ncbi:MAG TPA: sigma-70 family RNA polymerase sigma factor [Planctomycetota bacterium]|nr:sigma-70 family RNA polymerase sigma factor [Planctomycetota bacterium]
MGESSSNLKKSPADSEAKRNLRFVRLFSQHEHRIYSYIVALLSNWADADEVMQETSIALWEMFEQFQEGTDFSSWACRVAHFRVLRFRQQRQRDRHEFGEDLVESLGTTAATEMDTLEERRMALAGCMDNLSPEDRELLKRCYSEGVLIKEIAEQLNRPVKGIYKDLARIRRALFECVGSKAVLPEGGR